MQNITGSFSGRTITQTTMSLHDVPNHDLNLMQVQGLQKSSDENWNNVKITYWGTTDLIAGQGPQRGYFVNQHADGDYDFGAFEGKVAITATGGTLEGTWKYTGGTGQFKGIIGGGTYKGRLTSPVDVENAWEGSYQLAAKTQAA
jgi:hypothetical protein